VPFVFRRARRSGILSLVVSAMLPAALVAQSTDSARIVAPSTPARWHLQTSTFYSDADNGYGVWRGGDVRLLYSAKRLSPFVSVGTQSRPSGRQETYAVGSYIVLTPWMYSIVGIGTAPDNGTILFPKLRSDASLFVAVPKAKGLLVSTGFTDLRYKDSRAGGRIVSVGPMLYHGRGIYNASVFFNQDRASGARSTSWQAGGQWGTQGKFWVGGGVGSGNEAYRLLSATPFDARFRSQSLTVFGSKWITRGSGVTLRLDYERKVDVFNRRAAGLTYFVDF
jgi:YaiO family outer membrane protein